MSGVNGINSITIATVNMAASRRFYLDGLGGSLVMEWGHITVAGAKLPFGGVLLAVGSGNHIELVPLPGDAPESQPYPYRHLGFATDDCDATYASAMAAGGVAKPMGPGWDGGPPDVTIGDDLQCNRVAFLTGPNGETVELIQRL